jgi:CMP-N-acetylneuraminic acid synthetase
MRRPERPRRVPKRRSITIAIIPARAGSQGLPGKNRKRVGGFSLVELAIDVAKRSRVCDLCVVTSDDPILLAQARRAGAVAIRRPKRLATGRARTIDALRHAIAEVERGSEVHCDPIIVLEPTAPLRRPDDVRAALKLNLIPGRPNVFSASFVQDSDWLFRIAKGGKARWLRRGTMHERRQDQRDVYVPNPVVYVISRALLDRPWMEGAVAYPTPPDRSVEVDDARDLWIARALAGARVRRGTIV